MNTHARALFELHVCVVLWGFTAILGKLITLPAAQLVWWRMLLVTLALACFPRVWRAVRSIPPREVAIYAGIGCVIAVHWLCFYGSVKLANASVAATCMALAPVVVALVEPLITGARFERHNLLLGVLVIPGVALVVGGLPGEMRLGFWVGVASAALAAMYNLLNKRFLGQRDAMAVTWIELGAGFVLVALVATPRIALPSAQDGAWLLALAVFCTLIPFVVSLATLRHLSAFTAQLAINLEPLYAIVLAVLFLGEARQLDGLFFLGVIIVLLAVFGHGWLMAKNSTKQALTRESPSV